MGKREDKYYMPTEYEKYKNSMRARRNFNEESSEYSIHTDEHYYRQIQAENNRHTQRQQGVLPQTPQPPVNVISSTKKETEKFESVYDKIAQNKKNSKSQKTWFPNSDGSMPIGGYLDSEDRTKTVADTRIKQKTNNKELPTTNNVVGAVKVGKKLYNQTPITEEEMQVFIKQITDAYDFDEDAVQEEYYTREDIVGMCEYYRKKYSRKMWITLISSLTFFCILLALMYFYLNGYFDVFLI